MTLATKLTVQVQAVHEQVLDLVRAAAPLSYMRQTSLADGTGTGQADRIWHDTRTLAASATEDLDLAGVLVDAFGATVTFARVKGLVVATLAANTNNVVVGNATSNAWAALLGATGTLTVRPGAVVACFAGPADAVGYAVTAGTGDLLKVANGAGGTAVTYDIIVIGASV
jgi:hypothetical protein